MAGWQAVLKILGHSIDTESQCQHHTPAGSECKRSRSAFSTARTLRKDAFVNVNHLNSYNNDPQSGPPRPGETEAAGSHESALAYDSGSLLKGLHEVLIHHNGETYRLRLTKNNKLILHK